MNESIERKDAVASRGPDAMFRALFSRPFGPKAFAQYQAEFAKEVPAVFGVSEDDKARMNELLEQASAQARSRRHVAATMLGGIGAVMAATGADGFSHSNTNEQKAFSLSLGVVGGGTLIAGVLAAALTSSEEDLFHEHAVGIRTSQNPMMVVSNSESKLYALAEKYRSQRAVIRYAAFGLGALGIAELALTAANAKSDGERMGGYLVGGLVVVESAAMVLASYIKYPTEQMAELWSKDPGIKRLPTLSNSRASAKTAVTIQPTIGLDSIGLMGTF